MAEIMSRFIAMAPAGSSMPKMPTSFRFSSESTFDWIVLIFLPTLCLLWLLLALSHAIFFRHRVHVLYLQVTLALPAVMLMSWVSYFLPQSSMWLSVGERICEAWIVTAFGGLLHALIRYQGATPHRALADAKYARRFMSLGTFGCGCGPEQTAETALFWIRVMVFQFAFAAPLCGIFEAAMMYMGNDSEMAHLFFSVSRAISMVIALKALLTLYHAVHRILAPHRAFLKFFVVKLVFGALVLNSLILVPLIGKGVIKVPEEVCYATPLALESMRGDDESRDYAAEGVCAARYLFFISSSETFAIFLVVIFFYTTAEFAGEAPKTHGRGESVREKALDDRIASRGICGRCVFVLSNAFRIDQVLSEWSCDEREEGAWKEEEAALELGIAWYRHRMKGRCCNE